MWATRLGGACGRACVRSRACKGTCAGDGGGFVPPGGRGWAEGRARERAGMLSPACADRRVGVHARVCACARTRACARPRPRGHADKGLRGACVGARAGARVRALAGSSSLRGKAGEDVRKRARGDAGARVRAGAWECTRARVPCALACLSAPPRGRLVGRHRLCAFGLVAEPTPRPRPPGGGGFFIFSLVLLPWWISMFWAAFFFGGGFFVRSWLCALCSKKIHHQYKKAAQNQRKNGRK